MPLTGKFRGFAHERCNLNFQISRNVPVVFHNLNYDSHFLIESLALGFPGKIHIIPKTAENYISFSKEVGEYSPYGNEYKRSKTHNNSDNSKKNEKSEKIEDSENIENKNLRKTRQKRIRYQFIDSLKFLQCSLDKLASYLPDDEKLILRKQFDVEQNDEKFKLLTRKGMYPYSYMDSWEKLDAKELPPIESFYNELNMSEITLEQYSFAKKVWDKFNIKSMREYTSHYLKTDVLLLADIFENFRDKCVEIYGLDPTHYIKLPAYSWDCLLKHKNARIELLKDIDQITFVERGLRGGICQCSLRHSKANNKYMPQYNKDDPSTYLMYYDVNNLYGWAMSQALPIRNFEWADLSEFRDVKEIEEFILNMKDDDSSGCILEVDLEYPPELHDLHNDLPFCSEHMVVGNSKDQKKLVLTLNNKTNYVLHYRTLKLALAHGLKLKKVHKILTFEQEAFLNSYIMLNTHQRAKSKNDFEKNLYKLMNNACFGKCLENVRNYADIKLLYSWDGYHGAKSYIGKPTFKRSIIFSENLVAIEMLRTNIVMNKPFIIGISILEISKTKMYQFHYDFMMKEFDLQHCKIAYCDTDSFIYEIKCEDIYTEFMHKNYNEFDTSDYPINNEYNIKQHNKKVLGKMKDENNGQIMLEFVGLRSKMYSFKVQQNENVERIIKKAKGVKKMCYVEKDNIRRL